MEPVEYPIDGILDLHVFLPREVPDLVAHYLDECRARHLLRVRIIHGKGRGVLRRTVHALLDQRTDVLRYHLAGEDASSWGATLVFLAPPSDGTT